MSLLKRIMGMLCFSLCIPVMSQDATTLPSSLLTTGSDLEWTCAGGASIRDGIVTASLPEGTTNGMSVATAPLDLSSCDYNGFRVSVRARAEGVADAERPVNGVKAMVRYHEIVFDETFYPQADAQPGTWNWTNLVFTVWVHGKKPREATLFLGIAGAGGKVEFDLSSLRVEFVRGVPTYQISNRDYRIHYPDNGLSAGPPLRGTMLGNSSEREFRDLAAMGATLVRYQMTCDWKKQFPEGDGIAQFRPWMEQKLAHLEEMLPWGRKYGIKICVDWHWPAGGNTDEKYSSNRIFTEKVYADLFVSQWEEIARRFKGNHDVIYGYDLVNEPLDRGGLLYDFPSLMRRCAEAIRAIDPDTPIIYEANHNAAPNGFGFLSPVRMDNVIYSVHMYGPLDFTHQGLFKKAEDWTPVAYPNSGKGWDKEWLRHYLKPVRDFQLETGARIFVGEFSAVAYAPGAADWLRDCIDLFREYGWDWTYHAFREATCWSLEHEGLSYFELKPAAEETDRMRVVREGFSK